MGPRYRHKELVRKLADTVSQDDCSPAFLLRLTETLHKVAAEPKDTTEKSTGPTFAINIDLGGGQSVSLTGSPADTLTFDANTGDVLGAGS